MSAIAEVSPKPGLQNSTEGQTVRRIFAFFFATAVVFIASVVGASALEERSPSVGAQAYAARMTSEADRLRGEAARVAAEAERLSREAHRLREEQYRLRIAAQRLEAIWQRDRAADPSRVRDFPGRDRSQQRMLADTRRLARDASRLRSESRTLVQEAARLRNVAAAVDAEAQEELFRRFRLLAR
jgi:hypothetical protein